MNATRSLAVLAALSVLGCHRPPPCSSRACLFDDLNCRDALAHNALPIEADAQSALRFSFQWSLRASWDRTVLIRPAPEGAVVEVADNYFCRKGMELATVVSSRPRSDWESLTQCLERADFWDLPENNPIRQVGDTIYAVDDGNYQTAERRDGQRFHKVWHSDDSPALEPCLRQVYEIAQEISPPVWPVDEQPATPI